MNFEIVRQNNGNLVAMFATVAELGTTKLSSKNKPYQSVKLIDDNQEGHNMTIHQGNGSLLDATALGQRLAFNIQTYQGQQGLAYSGYWNKQINQQPQSVPPQPTQAPQQTTGPPKNNKQPDWDAIAEGKVRHGLVCAYIQSPREFTMATLGEIEDWKTYIMTGHHPNNVPQPDQSIQENPEIPF